MPRDGEDVYATLLLNDMYLPGALVLAHSLKDAGTTKKVVVLTTDSVSVDARAQLQRVFDSIIPVETIANGSPENLHLMGRPDLHSTFTKIVLWKQLMFRRIVYMDADMVAIRAPDELFDLPQPFSAAPDIGWPDIFNTGLMVLDPNMGDYYALLAMAQRGISFDGADQGLLNMHFKNTFNRLSFTYNVTPSAHYQYLPAFRHFESSISMAHFIGQNKPWTQGRQSHSGATPYDQMFGRWWAVYDRHYKESSVESSVEGSSSIVQYHTRGEFRPGVAIGQSEESKRKSENVRQASKGPFHEGLENRTVEGEADTTPVHNAPTDIHEENRKQPETHYAAWDASRAPPPTHSKPEASNFPATHYDMSSDYTPFKAPERYPDPPKDMYYEVPKTPTYQKPAPIFPWEKNAPKPSRVFAEDNLQFAVPTFDSSGQPSSVSTGDDKSAPTYTRGNAWDDIPEIERYIGNLQKNRKGNIQILQGYQSELERPSLPVTPAPIRRPSFWGEERDAEGELPAAEGVPSQEDWDPAAQLEQLARRQSDVLSSKLGSSGSPAREIPSRPLPYGSENVPSPTYVARAPTSGTSDVGATPRTTMEEPSYHGPSAMWEKDETFPSAQTPAGATEEEMDVLNN